MCVTLRCCGFYPVLGRFTSHFLADIKLLKTRNSPLAPKELGLYYLQSRYYDPDLCRFLNADAFISTGQGELGNNMFDYCLNNPLCYTDDTGELAYPGEIHNAVVRYIKNAYGFYSEQKITYSEWYKGRRSGRADLISADGQVWDVKRDRPWHIAEGKDQVNNYVRNTWKNHPDVVLKVGGTIKSGSFYYTSGIMKYKVTYRYAGNGVIAYDYDLVDINLNMNMDLFFVACMGAASGAIFTFTMVHLHRNIIYAIL